MHEWNILNARNRHKAQIQSASLQRQRPSLAYEIVSVIPSALSVAECRASDRAAGPFVTFP